MAGIIGLGFLLRCGFPKIRPMAASANLEGIVAKPKNSPHVFSESDTPWLKIKNRDYSQQFGRDERRRDQERVRPSVVGHGKSIGECWAKGQLRHGPSFGGTVRLCIAARWHWHPGLAPCVFVHEQPIGG
jgi:hypothetical protein